MITGYLCLILTLFLLTKYIVRRKGGKKLKQVFFRLHIPLGVASILAVLIHMMMTYRVWNARALLVIISGIITACAILCVAASYLFRKRKKGSWIKVHRIVALMALFVLVVNIATYYVDFISYKQSVQEIKVGDIDLSKVKDRSYEGEYDVGYINASVLVEVKGHKIAKVKILAHKTERGRKAEKIAENIVTEQRTTIDAVSGATNSSLVIEKAVEEALLKGVRK